MSSTVKLAVSGMKCGGCKTTVEKALHETAGVESVEVSLEEGSAIVRGDADPVELARVVTEAGYPATVA